MANVQSVKLTIDVDNIDEGLKQLLQKVKSTWKWNNIKQQQLSGGYSCVMLRCHENNNLEDSVTIRIRNLMTMLDEEQSQLEIKVLKHLSQIGYFPDLLGTFSNGYCYQYVKGKPVMNLRTGEFTINDTMLRATARKLALLHTIQIPGTDMATPTVFAVFESTVKNSSYVPHSSRCASKEVLLNECLVVEKFCNELNATVGLCHGDCHPGNMIWNDEQETITFVDWELVHVGYQCYDIAHFLGLVTKHWPQICKVFVPNVDYSAMPPNVGDTFCQYYYEEWCKTQHKTLTKTELDIFKLTVENFQLCVAFMLLMFGATVPKDKFILIM